MAGQCGEGFHERPAEFRTKDGGVDFLEGKVGDITNESVVFQSQGESVPAKRSKIDGMIIFHKADDTSPATVCVVQDAAGNRFNARSVSLADSSLQVGGASGVSFTVPWVDVARLDYSVGKVVYLSDLEPQSMRWSPYFDFGKSAPALAQFYAPRRDMGLDHQSAAFGRPNIFQRIGAGQPHRNYLSFARRGKKIQSHRRNRRLGPRRRPRTAGGFTRRQKNV